MIPRIGALRRHLGVEVATHATDGAGGAVKSWHQAGSVFGRVEPLRRREGFDDGRAVGLVTHRVTVRQSGGVARGVRFVDGGVRYRVLAVEHADPRRRFLECLCEEEQR